MLQRILDTVGTIGLIILLGLIAQGLPSEDRFSSLGERHDLREALYATGEAVLYETKYDGITCEKRAEDKRVTVALDVMAEGSKEYYLVTVSTDNTPYVLWQAEHSFAFYEDAKDLQKHIIEGYGCTEKKNGSSLKV